MNASNHTSVFPDSLVTERLVLRRYADNDAQELRELIERNQEQLIQNFAPTITDILHGPTELSFVGDAARQWQARQAFHYGVWRKPAAGLIGQIKIKSIVWEIPSAELSYFIDAAAQRQGFAAEAVSSILQVAFSQLNFQRIYLRIIPSNQRSLLLAEKLGFRHEGLLRNAFRCGLGQLHDLHIYARTQADFTGPPGNSSLL